MLKQKQTPYTYILFLLLFSEGMLSQTLHLKTITKDSLEHVFLSKIKYQKKHKTLSSIQKEVDRISSQLKKIGFFTNHIDTILKKDTLYIAQFYLGKKTSKAIVTIPADFKIQNSTFKIHQQKIVLPIHQLSSFLEFVSHQLEKKGKSFAEITLKNIRIKKETLFATLTIRDSKKRTIDKIIIKGYEKFPASFIKHYLKSSKKSVFNQKKLKTISSAINTLDFVSEIKSPEVLFSKDSTLLYVYLKKEQNNSFDGLLNFSSKKNKKGIQLNGHIDLKLKNLFDYGTSFNVFWNSIGDEKQELILKSEIPFIFDSSFSVKNSFELYKQDSTFINTSFKTTLSYFLNKNSSISFTLKKENSNDLLQTNTNIQSFKNTFTGLQFSYQSTSKDSFNKNMFFAKLNPSIGNRIVNNKKTRQIKIDFESSWIWHLTTRSSIFIRNETGFLNSSAFLENEKYRIGGINSIRGFNEQSLFTTQFSYFNTEYRYLTSKNSYVYSITDFGTLKNNTHKSLLSYGIGYFFKIDNSFINLGYVTGNDKELYRSSILLKIGSFF